MSVRPQNWKALAPLIPNFAHQSSTLPRLPVPSLEATLQRVKDSLSPLARSTEEFENVCKKIDAFGRPDGLGPILQQLLLQRKHEKDNWLEELWDDMAHLSSRDSLAYNATPYAGFVPQPAHLPQTPAARAAALSYATMVFRQKLRSGKLAPETIKGDELCMDAYRWIFDCCRIPGAQDMDWNISYADSTNPDVDLGHVIVIRKNRFWKLKAQVGDEIVGMSDLIRQFQFIYDHATDDGPAIGALTSQDRESWAKDYAHISSVPQNAAIFREIHSSAFVISLDDSTPAPENDVDVSRALLHGTLPSPTNPRGISRGLSSRYFDKSFQLIVFDNGVAGQMGEHSVVDGTHYIHLCDEVLAFLADPKSDFKLSPSPSVLTPPEPLDFDLTSIPEIYQSIASAQQFVYDLASSKSLSMIRTNYGKAAIKAFGVGPDGWAQMLIQVAYARLAERFGGEKGPVIPWPVCTLEAGTTRRFYKGRGECIKVVTDECVAFVRAMLGYTATREEKVRLLRDAVRKHQQLTSEAGRGEGVNRHLLGCFASLPPNVDEPFFDDPLYERSVDGTLYSSALFSKYIQLYGWGEWHTEGFGIPYMTGFDDYLQFTITSPCTMPNAEFAEEIGKAADDLYQLFASGPSAKQSRGLDVNARL